MLVCGSGFGGVCAGFMPPTSGTQFPQCPFHPEICTASWAWELRTEYGLLQTGKSRELEPKCFCGQQAGQRAGWSLCSKG